MEGSGREMFVSFGSSSWRRCIYVFEFRVED